MAEKDYDYRYDEEDLLEEEEERSNKRGIRILLIIVAVVLLLFGAVYTGWYAYNQYNALNESKEYTQMQYELSTEKEDKKVKNPIDFDKLTSKNDEIFAWLKVPDTKVDYPMVQSAVDDEFYLKHSALDKSWVASGAIYIELSNHTTLDDRVTVIYGHNGYSDTMFTTLHYFEDTKFFNTHPYFYIYTPKAKLTYQIVSAFKYDNRHLMNSFDFLDNQAFLDFEAMIQNPTSANKNVRKDLDNDITINDNIVVLSTCIKNQSSNRYLVCGVLTKNEKTY